MLIRRADKHTVSVSVYTIRLALCLPAGSISEFPVEISESLYEAWQTIGPMWADVVCRPRTKRRGRDEQMNFALNFAVRSCYPITNRGFIAARTKAAPTV